MIKNSVFGSSQTTRRYVSLSILALAIAAACTGLRGPGGDVYEVGRLTADREYRSSKSSPPVDPVPRGPFGLSMVAGAEGKAVDIDAFVTNDTCGECHERQLQEMNGSMHSVAHVDRLYRSTAEIALHEAGPEVYALCAGCHTPHGVASGLVPDTPEEELPEVVKAGVLCDVCHQVSALSGGTGPWGEPGNGSIVLAADEDRKFGPPTGDDDAAMHTVETRDFLSKSEFCASCHTVIHPFNGVRLEHTYAEWKSSVYAEAGIQCQDCHMRSVSDAQQVARTMKPVELTGLSEPSGEERPIARHFFAGGNFHADKLGGGTQHARMAAERLRGAASLELGVPADVHAGETMDIEVTVRNIGAGHSLPTSLVELRRVWVDLRVADELGNEIYRSGWLDEGADLSEDVMRFGALAGDAAGQPTYKPWEVTHFIWKRVIPAKSAAADSFRVRVPPDAGSRVTIEARLFYRLVPDFVARAIMGEHYVELEPIEIASASAASEVLR
jgi:hypothetical protein